MIHLESEDEVVARFVPARSTSNLSGTINLLDPVVS